MSFDPVSYAMGKQAGGGGGGGSGIILTKHEGTYTPTTDSNNMIVTGLPYTPWFVQFYIDDPDDAVDGVLKTCGGMAAFGMYVGYATGNNGTGGTAPSSNAMDISTVFDRIVYSDGATNDYYSGRVIITESGFNARRSASGNYPFKAGYNYKWIAYTAPVN